MKKILLILTLFVTYLCNGQDYRCLQPGAKSFYTNGNGYLRGMRIDSVRASGSDTIFYTYHTPRGNYANGALDSSGGSWLGKKVIKQASGTYLFDNMWQDTVVIKTQAQVGDTWTFYRENIDTSYKATITRVDTMTVLGVVDSVKVIAIVADTNGVMNAQDPVNNFEIVLSKNHGFVQVFDLYTFPYRLTNVISTFVGGLTSFDYYLDLVLGDLIEEGGDGIDGGSNNVTTVNSIFHLIPFHNPTNMELYNYSVGEILEFSEGQSNNYGSGGSSTSTETLDSIISKTTTSLSVSYVFAQKASSVTYVSSGIGMPTITNSYSSGIGTSSYDATLLIDTAVMPEEWNAQYFYHFYPKATYDSGMKCPDTVCIVDVNNIAYPSGIVEFEASIPFSSPGAAYIGNNTSTYSIGFGLTGLSYKNYTNTTSGDPVETKWGSYIYTDNDGIICGRYSPVLSVTQVNAVVNKVYIFPNPVSGELNISASANINQIDIANLLGQTVYRHDYNTDKVQVDVAGLPSGIYLLRVNGSEVRKFVKE